MGSTVRFASTPLVRKMLPSNWEFFGGVFGSRYGIFRIWRDVSGRILVLLNIREGIREFFNMTNLGRIRVQILDYEGVPF